MENLIASERIIEMNHALNGFEGKEITELAFRIIEARQKVLLELRKTENRENVLMEELKGYLDEFMENKLKNEQKLKRNEFFKKDKPKVKEYNHSCYETIKKSLKIEKAINSKQIELNRSEEIVESKRDLQLLKSLYN